MAATTSIEWTDRTWNPVVGCSLVSPGCTNCYAMRMAGRIEAMGTAPHYAGLTRPSKAGPVWTGEVRAAPDHVLLQPLRWRKPARIFVNSMSDLFHEGVPDAVIDRVFAVMALTPHHTFQVLTKRPERMRSYLSHPTKSVDVGLEALGITLEVHSRTPGSPVGKGVTLKHSDINPGALSTWHLPNVWLGVSVEDQARADERIPVLLDTPAAVRWISAEPLLGPIDLTRLPYPNRGRTWMIDAVRGEMREPGLDRTPIGGVVSLDWVVAGGESGPDARPMHPDWARSLRDQCAAAEVPFLFKQWGSWSPVSLEIDDDGGAAYPMPGCSDPAAHKAEHECLFWKDGHLVHWPQVERFPAVGVRRVGKGPAGRLLDGVIHDAFPERRP
jgi:protein gp37